MTSREREIAQLLAEYEMPKPREEFADALEARLAGVRPRRMSVGWLVAAAAAAAVVVAIGLLVRGREPVAVAPAPETSPLARGVELATAGRYGPALREFRRARAQDRHSSTVWVNLGAAYLEMGDYEEALAHARRAIELDPRRSVAFANLGTILARHGDSMGALACFDCALELDPADPVAHAGRAEVLWALGRHQEARAAEARAKELGGGRTGVRFVRDR